MKNVTYTSCFKNKSFRLGISFRLFGKRVRILLINTLLFTFLWAGSTVWAGEKITVGFVEEVILLPWGIRIPARIDTGAATSSLDVREITVKDKIVEFKLPEKYGGLAARLPLIGWKTVRSAEAKEERPVVEIEMCLGSKRLRTLVNLNDRSRVTYPMLIGRNTLKNHFIVDCDKSYCTSPACPEVISK